MDAKKSNPLKVRSIKKFMQDQTEHEIKRHEKLKKIVVEEWTKGEYTFNPSISEYDNTITNEQKKGGRKPYVPEDYSYMPQINEKSKKILRNTDIVTWLVTDGEMRTAKKEQSKQKKAVEDASKSRLDAVKPCDSNSQIINFRAFENDFIAAALKTAEGDALPATISV